MEHDWIWFGGAISGVVAGVTIVHVHVATGSLVVTMGVALPLMLIGFVICDFIGAKRYWKSREQWWRSRDS